MKLEKANAGAHLCAVVTRGGGMSEEADAHGVYVVDCYDSDGNLKWSDTIDNLVTTVGKNYLLDQGLAGSSYTATWYLGLIGSSGYTSGPSTADTMGSHGGWVECGGATAPAYSQGARPTAAWAAATGGSKSLSAAAQYTISGAGGTVKGCFLTTVATKDGATGTLYSAGVFSGGDKAVGDGDTLSVSYTASL